MVTLGGQAIGARPSRPLDGQDGRVPGQIIVYHSQACFMFMSSSKHREIAAQGLWHNNQALVALLGLCPLLAVSNTLLNGVTLGLATTGVMVVSNSLIAAVRARIIPGIRLPLFVLVIAVTVTVMDLLMQAFLFELHKTLGLFIPLIVTNCAILGRIEVFASRQAVREYALDGLYTGTGFSSVLAVLGAGRELLGQGTLLGLPLLDQYEGFLLALMPAGAFIALGLLIALRNAVSLWFSQRDSA